MAKTNRTGADAFGFNRITLISHDGVEHSLGDGSVVTQGFMYYEDITKSFISANLRIVDSGVNLIATAPIVGGEVVRVELTGPNDDEREYEFKVYSVTDRSINNKVQQYNLGLISPEYIDTMGAKVNQSLTGTADSIIQKVIQNYVQSPKPYLPDPVLNSTFVPPSIKNPWAICAYLQDNAILAGKSSLAEGKGSSAGSSGATLGGTAGFLFYENAKGYNFRSIDTLCSIGDDQGIDGSRNKQEVVREFRDEPSDIKTDSSILSVQFLSEINILNNSMLGTYSSQAEFYDINTGKYTKYNYSLENSYENQSHLGVNDLNQQQKELSRTPVRRFSAILDSEVHHNGSDAGSFEEGNVTNPYQDWTKFTLVQSFSRNILLNTQGLKIEVPGNIDLVVGDKIRVVLPNSVDQKEREKQDIDLENSGYYLITQLSRYFNGVNRTVTTILKLQRDSYGAPEDPIED